MSRNPQKAHPSRRSLPRCLFWSLSLGLLLASTSWGFLGCGPDDGTSASDRDGGAEDGALGDGALGDAASTDGQPESDGTASHDGGGGDASPLPDGAASPDAAVAPDSAVNPDAAVSPDAAVLTDEALPDWSWYHQAEAVCDRTSLSAGFLSAGYTPPAGAHVMAAEVVDGVGGPAFRFYTWNDTGFTYSPGQFWPASTVKLTAAVGALRTLADYGLTGAASLSFTDDDGFYDGTVENLYDLAISVSDNVAYNRLMEIAGFDTLNDDYLVEAEALPLMVLQRRYTHPYPSSDLRTSPAMDYV